MKLFVVVMWKMSQSLVYIVNVVLCGVEVVTVEFRDTDL